MTASVDENGRYTEIPPPGTRVFVAPDDLEAWEDEEEIDTEAVIIEVIDEASTLLRYVYVRGSCGRAISVPKCPVFFDSQKDAIADAIRSEREYHAGQLKLLDEFEKRHLK